MIHKCLWLSLILLTACSAAGSGEIAKAPAPENTAVATPIPEANVSPDSTPGTTRLNRRVPIEDAIFSSFSLGFDSIQPIYVPEFLPAAEAPLENQELVLGIAWDGEAKAYPNSVLRFREMVDDNLAGIPTLVTW